MMMMSKDVAAILTRCSLASLLPCHRRKVSPHHQDRIFDQQLERADQLSAERAVDRAMIAGHRHAHDLRHLDLAVFDDRALLTGADREDGGMRRVDHGGDVLSAVRAPDGYGCISAPRFSLP